MTEKAMIEKAPKEKAMTDIDVTRTEIYLIF